MAAARGDVAALDELEATGAPASCPPCAGLALVTNVPLAVGAEGMQRSLALIAPPTGATPLHVAAQRGQAAAVRWLLDHGADPVRARFCSPRTPRVRTRALMILRCRTGCH